MNRSSGLAVVAIGTFTATVPTFLLFQMVTFLFIIPLALGAFCIFLGIIALRTQRTSCKSVGWIAFIVMLIAVFFPFGLIAYYNRSGYPIEIVVPSGFRGPMWIVEDSQAGEVIPLAEGKHRIKIPKSGVLRIKSTDMFAMWHSETWRYSHGTIIPQADLTKVPDNVIALHHGGYMATTRHGKELRFMPYYIGTNLEAHRFLEIPSCPPE